MQNYQTPWQGYGDLYEPETQAEAGLSVFSCLCRIFILWQQSVYMARLHGLNGLWPYNRDDIEIIVEV
jgi:hypothetical protein